MIDPELADNIREDAGSRIAALDTSLRCNRCGRGQSMTKEQAAQYLREGWPECCEETMELVRKAAP